MAKIIVVSGACFIGNCDCMQFDQMPVDQAKKLPPFHDGCTCYTVDEKQEWVKGRVSQTLQEEFSVLHYWEDDKGTIYAVIKSRFDLILARLVKIDEVGYLFAQDKVLYNFTIPKDL